jgi:hypothetical protein
VQREATVKIIQIRALYIVGWVFEGCSCDKLLGMTDPTLHELCFGTQLDVRSIYLPEGQSYLLARHFGATALSEADELLILRPVPVVRRIQR